MAIAFVRASSYDVGWVLVECLFANFELLLLQATIVPVERTGFLKIK
jgi:hypothetical protein